MEEAVWNYTVSRLFMYNQVSRDWSMSCWFSRPVYHTQTCKTLLLKSLCVCVLWHVNIPFRTILHVYRATIIVSNFRYHVSNNYDYSGQWFSNFMNGSKNRSFLYGKMQEHFCAYKINVKMVFFTVGMLVWIFYLLYMYVQMYICMYVIKWVLTMTK